MTDENGKVKILRRKSVEGMEKRGGRGGRTGGRLEDEEENDDDEVGV
jgi:hypothetical protein